MRKSIQIVIALAAFASFAFINPKGEPKQINVVIDAGHGGHDFGATRDNISEKTIVKAIANKVKSQNGNKNVVLHITRISDEFVDLSERTAFINKLKPDLVVSLHVNMSPVESQSGVEIYIAEDNAANEMKSNEYAQSLSQKLERNHHFKVSEIKKAPYMILNKSNVPAIIVELGFLSNEKDRAYLTSENEQNKIANTILEFLSETE